MFILNVLLAIYLSFIAHSFVSSPLIAAEYAISEQGNAVGKFPSESAPDVNGAATIICTVDGNIHGLDTYGKTLWTRSSGGAMVAAQNYERHTPNTLGKGHVTPGKRNYAVLPAIDGALIYSSLEGLRKTGITTRMLAEQAPFVSQEGISFTGSTRTRIMSLDARSGTVLFDSEGKLQTAPPTEGALPVWFGRVDYFVRAVDTLTGREEFNLSYSVLQPVPYSPSYGTGALAGVTAVSAAPLSELNSADDEPGGDSALSVIAAEGSRMLGVLGDRRAPRAGTEESDGESDSDSDDESNAGEDNEALVADSQSQGMLPGSQGDGALSRAKRTQRPRRKKDARAAAGGGGRRKRKGRMRREQRAGEAQMLRERILRAAQQGAEDEGEAAAAPLDADSMAVISTPDGELYFSDLDGTVVERVPVSLKSPVMQAFNLRRVPGPASADGARAADSWDIRQISVHHRIITRRGDSAQGLIGADGGTNKAAIASPQQAGRDEETTVVVQSPQGFATAARGTDDGALFALEVRELEMPPLEEGERSGGERGGGQARPAQGLIAGGAPVQLLQAPEERSAASAPAGNAVGRNKVHLQGKGLPELAFAGLGKGKNKRKRQILEQFATVVGDQQASCASQRSLCVAGDALAGEGCETGCAEDQLPEGTQDLASGAAGSARAGSGPAVRGRHVLRADLYDGELFRPDEAMQLFSGMLSPPLVRADDSGAGGRQQRSPGPSHPVELPLPATYDPRVASAWRLAELLMRANGAAAYALVGLVAVAVAFMALLLVLVLFPAKEGMLSEVSCWLRRTLLAHLQGPAASTARVPVAGVAIRKTKKIGIAREDSFSDKKTENGTENLPQQPPEGQQLPTVPPLIAAIPAVLPPPGVAAVEGVDPEGRRTLQVGSLLVLPDQILGYGSHGTVVYRGSLHGRPLAVKRVLSQFVKAAEREIALLIRSDGHPNVVRYFTKEEHSDFVYLGLQLCEMTLKDYIVRACERAGSAPGRQPASTGALVVPDDVRDSLLQVSRGLAHLHANKIVHRDLKPHNILCFAPESAAADAAKEQDQPASSLGAFVLKISDMGLSKQLDREHHSFSSLSLSVSASLAGASGRPGGMSARTDHSTAAAADAAVGTVGWQAPELIKHRYNGASIGKLDSPATSALDHSEHAEDEGMDGTAGSSSGLSAPDTHSETALKLQRKRTLTVDVFSLGCVFYFTITLGSHPFGQWFEREANIAAGRVDLSHVRDDPAALDLIAWMLHPDPHLRPSSKGVCAHAFFWPATKRLDFLMEFSDRLEQEPADADVVLALEAGVHAIQGGRWDAALDALLLADLSRFRKYDCTSVRDLLRVIRNKRHHFYELPPELRAAMGALPADFLRYFESRFPHLLLHCATVAGSFLQKEAPFACCAGSTSPPRCRRAEAQLAPCRLPAHQPPASGADHPSPSAGQDKELLPDSDTSRVLAWPSARRGGAWWPSAESWVAGAGGERKRTVASHLAKATEDAKYRTRLCSQWEESSGVACAMRKKGKCVFAHGPLELRAKDSRRGKWGRPLPAGAAAVVAWESSGGENVLGDARMLAQGRSAMVAGVVANAGGGATAGYAEHPPNTPTHEDALLWQQQQLLHQQQYQQQQQQYYQPYPLHPQQVLPGSVFPWGTAPQPIHQSAHQHQQQQQQQQQQYQTHPHAGDQRSQQGQDGAEQRRSNWDASQGYPGAHNIHNQSSSYYR